VLARVDAHHFALLDAPRARSSIAAGGISAAVCSAPTTRRRFFFFFFFRADALHSPPDPIPRAVAAAASTSAAATAGKVCSTVSEASRDARPWSGGDRSGRQARAREADTIWSTSKSARATAGPFHRALRGIRGAPGRRALLVLAPACRAAAPLARLEVHACPRVLLLADKPQQSRGGVEMQARGAWHPRTGERQQGRLVCSRTPCPAMPCCCCCRCRCRATSSKRRFMR
jgi:hypothetical protein